MKAYIIDDEQANREVVRIMLEKYFPEIELIGDSEHPDRFLNSTSLQSRTTILFLDILMPEKTGFDLLNSLKSRAFEVILITGFEEFALQAFEHSVIDYVLKPIDKDRFCTAVEKALDRIRDKQFIESVRNQTVNHAKIPMIKNNKTVYIESSSIAYMIGQSGGYTTVFCKNGESYVLSRSLSSLETEYAAISYLVRASQSVIINLQDIAFSEKGGSGYIALNTNNFEVFLPRRRKKEVLQRVEAYLKSQA